MTDVAELAPAPASEILAPMRGRGVTAVLGPTNTGKTHLAIERMAAHGSGLIGLPLRLLAREVYGRLVEKVGAEKVALVTGEEKIKPQGARFWVATVEAMPRDLDVDFVAIDEIQLAADLDRGHVFTDRLLNLRGRYETLALGAATMRPLVEQLLPGANVVTRPRLSNLVFAGEKKLSRLPRRTAIVAFSSEEVYAIAELIRRQRGGAAVVLGALSPRTRNAQVAMYQAGDVDYLIATDAIGMGLNLDVDHVAFAGDRKFDGHQFRRLNPSEMAQIAGRAGRHLRDGSFGTTGRCPPFEPELVERLEGHKFESVRVAQWRNRALDFSSVERLIDSLSRPPAEAGLTRAPDADDLKALMSLARQPEIRDAARGARAVSLLWDVCLVPDYRKIAPTQHTELLADLYGFLVRLGKVPTDWFARQVAVTDRTDGDIDTLSARIAHVRTWTFVANRPDWLDNPEHWQGVTRAVEDRLSDALHDRLAQRFVDRRTSVLMRRLRENERMEAEIDKDGGVKVEGHHVGRLAGFQFAPEISGDGPDGKALRAAAAKALSGEIETRANRFANSSDGDIVLAADGAVRWQGELVGRIAKGDKTLAPKIRVFADDQLTGTAREQVDKRLDQWLRAHVTKLLGPLAALETAEDVTGVARGVAYQLVEELGVLDRARVAEEVKGLDQTARAALRKHGVRFGAHHIYLPLLMKPAPRALAAQLWALTHDLDTDSNVGDVAHLAAAGRTSMPADPQIDKGVYRALGYRVCGARAIRVDILERLADLIRPAIAWKPGQPGTPPPGATDGYGFTVTVAMTSLAGCSGEDFAAILRALGYRMERKPKPAAPEPAAAAAPAAESTAEAAAGEIAETVETSVPDSGTIDASSEAVDAAPAEEPAAEAVESETASAEEPAAESAPVADAPVFDAAEDAPALLDPAASDDIAIETAAEAVEEAAPGAEPTAEAAEAVAEASVEAAEEAAPDATATPAADAAAVEPEFIEVWRPGGFGRREQRPGRDNRRGPGRPGEPRPEGEARPGGRPGGDRRHSGPRAGGDRGPRQGEQRTGDQKAGEQRSGEPRQGDQRGERKFGGRPGGTGRPGGEGRPGGGDRRGPRPERGDRGKRGFDGPMQAGPKRPERALDPDSPFAKLAALKAQLEGKGPGKGKGPDGDA
ncbi:helicase-related protein [Chenggangzhangella methanolivorans]|uniref:Helicase n=1 Tax=Chenggangzhangella methanolivorans TaxID=1437009 RepID=A0A9E6R6P6_9HYPH|nr:helicase-related protein [Chenggangzhangella methanolivorans]QZN98406.1 helicase [Chenggangzhangella methanolivorans]